MRAGARGRRGRYGWHRDELYYAVAGLHLQGGYVEFPRVTALLAALARELFGWSLVGLRAITITWQVGLSFNCNNPSFAFCQNPETGEPELGGFWGWFEFDRFADGSITGDAQVEGCGHTTGGGGPGSAGAGHADVDITSVHLGPPQPQDPNFGTPGAQVFYVDSNVVNGEPNNPDFLGDSGIPAEAGHFSSHPAPGVAGELQVAFRPAK